MTFRRILILAGVLLILYLAMYSWNQRTRVLDDFAANVALEVSGGILTPLRMAQRNLVEAWDRYFDLVGVREENQKLKARLAELESTVLAHGEDLAELRRLRELVKLPDDVSWRPLGVRILAGRMGPNSILDSIIISRGYANGARPGTPLVTNKGLVGRVFKASPHTSTIMLITDPASKIAVLSQKGRGSGILEGRGTGQNLDVNFVQRNDSMEVGEVLITSGLDGKYPKGIPVARVTSVSPSNYTQFMAIEAIPMADLLHLEEAVLLEPTGISLPPAENHVPPESFVGPPTPQQATP